MRRNTNATTPETLVISLQRNLEKARLEKLPIVINGYKELSATPLHLLCCHPLFQQTLLL
jgi:hypothetical protein